MALTIPQDVLVSARMSGSELRREIAVMLFTKRNWIHSAYAFGDSTDCTANTWRTLLADLSCAPIAGPTPTSPSDPPPTAVPTMQPLEPVAGAPTPRPTLAPPCRAAVIVLMSDGQPNQGDPQPVADAAKAEASVCLPSVWATESTLA